MAYLFEELVIADPPVEKKPATFKDDMISGLVFSAANLPKGYLYEKAVMFSSINEVPTAGDSENGKNLRYQIEQYFRMNPASCLWVMVTKEVSYLSVLNDSTGPAIEMANQAGGEIRQIGIYSYRFNARAVAEAQTLANQLYLQNTPTEIILAGTNVTVNTSIDLTLQKAKNVSVVIAKDLEAPGIGLGVLLGAVSAARVYENIAWIEKFNLFGSGFTNASIDNKTLTDISLLQQQKLNEKGYIFALSHTGIRGLYFNDSYTATANINDFAYIENNRTTNKAIRLVSQSIRPVLSAIAPVEPATGILPKVLSKALENLALNAMEMMIASEEISEADVYVDPTQDVLNANKLMLKINLVPSKIGREIGVDVVFEDPFTEKN